MRAGVGCVAAWVLGCLDAGTLWACHGRDFDALFARHGSCMRWITNRRRGRSCITVEWIGVIVGQLSRMNLPLAIFVTSKNVEVVSSVSLLGLCEYYVLVQYSCVTSCTYTAVPYVLPL